MNNEFETRLKAFVEGCQKIVNDDMDKNFSILVEKFGYPKIYIHGGRKYIKIARDANQTSVHCFVDTTNGDVLKAAGWNAPAKHARGNIFNADNGLSCMGPYGAAYLR